jgi:3-oxoacyl-[acyl-carrier protein] reductase
MIMAGIEGQVAVVTGAASGIGQTIAQKLSSEGAHVCIVDINGEKAEEVASELNRQGYRASAHRVDVAQSEQVSAFFDEVERTHGLVHILVNNAGIAGRPYYVTEMDDQTWLTMLSIHANGSFFCLREAAKIMKRHRYGRIVNMSSLAAERGIAGHVHYTAAKYAIVGLTEVAAKELGQFNITVNAIKPGLIRTPLAEEGLLATEGERLRMETPVRKIGETEDVARAVSFLVQPESGFLTGISIIVDGGINIMDCMDKVGLEFLAKERN